MKKIFRGIDEVKHCASIKELRSLAREIEDNQILATCMCNEISAIGSLKDAPLWIEQEAEQLQIDPAIVSEDTMKDVQKGEVLLYTRFADDTTFRTVPVSVLGYRTYCERAGFKADSPALALRDKSKRSRLISSDMANVLNLGFQNSSKLALNIVRDEYLVASHSAEPGDYTYVPCSEICDAIETSLTTDPEISAVYVREASISPQYMNILVFLQAPKYKEEIQNLFESITGKKEDIEVGLAFQTSDVGLSGINVYPVFQRNKVIFYLGSAIKLDHRSKIDPKTGIDPKIQMLDKFCKNISQAFASLKDATEVVEKLGKVKLSYPRETVLNMGANVGLPARDVKLAAIDFESMYPSATYADAMFFMFEVAGSVGLVADRRVAMMENIWRLAYQEPKAFDHIIEASKPTK